MNHSILVKLFEDKSAYEIVEAPVFREIGHAENAGLAAAAFGPDVS